MVETSLEELEKIIASLNETVRKLSRLADRVDTLLNTVANGAETLHQ